MSDIFLSYASEDRERVAVVAKALESAGYSVWWDREIPLGVPFDEYIEKMLNEARCVIVAWSADSITSRWVKTEAEEARKRGVLVPILIDEVDPPFAFRLEQAAKLADWGEDSEHPEWRRLLNNLGRFVVAVTGRGSEAAVEMVADVETETGPEIEADDEQVAAVRHLPLTGGARVLVDHAKEFMRPDHSHLGLNHWLVVLLKRHRGMAERFAGETDLKAVLGEARRSIHDGNLGEALTVEDLLGRADKAARLRGNDQIWERDLALVLLEAAGLT